MIEALLGKRNSGHVDFVKHFNNNINRCSMPMTSGISESISVTSGFRESVPMAAGNSNSSQNNSWCQQFLANLDRRKGYVLKEMRNMIQSLRCSKKVVNLGASIKKLKSFRTIRESEPSREPSQAVKKHLSKIAMKVVGSKKYRDGYEMHKKITSLLKQVEDCHSSTVPEEICVHIAKTLEHLYEPSVEKLDELLQHAEQYMHVYLKKRAVSRRIAGKKLNKNVIPNENKNVISNEKNVIANKNNKKRIKNRKNKAIKKKKAKKSKNKHASEGKNNINAGKQKAKKDQ